MDRITIPVPLTRYQYRFLEKVATKRDITIGVLINGIVDKLIPRAPRPVATFDLTPMPPISGAKANRREMNAREQRVRELFDIGATDEQMAIVLRAKNPSSIRKIRSKLGLLREPATKRKAG